MGRCSVVNSPFSPEASPLRVEGMDVVPHPLLIEASAGSGKTWTLAHLSARFMIEEDIEPRELLLVTFTRDAARQLKGRIRRRLDELIEVFDREDFEPSWMAPYRDRWESPGQRERDLRRARSVRERVDDVDTRTFHSFAAQRADSVREGLGDITPYLERAAREVVAKWARENSDEFERLVEVWGESAAGRLEAIVHVARALEDSGWSESTSASTVRVLEPVERRTPEDFAAQVQSHLAKSAVTRARELGRRAGVQTFSDVVRSLGERLSSPEGEQLIDEFRARYRVVMIDEFQDTDPLQWRIVSDIFRGAPNTRLIMVGDPKQAIYGFRSGGVDTYLAVRHSLQDNHIITLSKNFRSTPGVVAGVNDVFRGAHLHVGVDEVDPNTEYPPAQAARTDAVPRRVTPTGDERSVTLRVVTGDLGDVERDVVRVVHHLRQQPGVSLRDIAIVCRRNDQCRQLLRALRRGGVAAVSESSHSVFDTEASFQLSQLVAAAADGNDVGLTHVLRLTWFRDACQGNLVLALSHLRRDMGRSGAIALSRFLLRRDVTATVARTAGGERHLTDLAHLSELIATSLSGVRSWRSVEDWLSGSLRRTESDVDEVARRLETDDDAVRVLTIHRSKGLEFPFVLMPHVAYSPPVRQSTGPKSVGRWVEGGVTVIDGGSGIDWGEDRGESRRLVESAQLAGEQRRLLYVALTRAAEGFVGWYRPPGKVPLANEAARLLFDREPRESGVWPVRARTYRELAEITGAKHRRRLDPSVSAHFPEELRGFDDWVDAAAAEPLTLCRYAFAHSAVRVESPNDEPVTPFADEVSLTATDYTVRTPPQRDGRWRRWSYSNVAYRLNEVGAGVEEETPGFDEAPVDAPEVRGDVARVFGGLAGRELGVGVHRALELLLSRQVLDPGEAVRHAFEESWPDRPLSGSEVGVVADALGRIRSRRFSAWSDLGLIDFTPDSAIAEMRFTLGLGAAHPGRLEALARRLTTVLDTKDFGDYFAASTVSALDEGWLVGSLDAVIMTSDERFRIVDYKTDQLPGASRPFRPDALGRHMRDHHYPWQALFYSVALHRFLGERVSGYNPVTHFGGVDYYFVRVVGDASAESNDGLYSWSPPVEAILVASQMMGALT